MNTGSRWGSRWLVVFWLYALLLFTGTHWPKLRIEGPIPRPDLYIHFAAFGLWAFCFGMCGFFEPKVPRFSMRNYVMTFFAGLVYAAFDEGLQAIPALGRTCAWDDYAANAGGILIGTLVLAAVGRFLARRNTAA